MANECHVDISVFIFLDGFADFWNNLRRCNFSHLQMMPLFHCAAACHIETTKVLECLRSIIMPIVKSCAFNPAGELKTDEQNARVFVQNNLPCLSCLV